MSTIGSSWFSSQMTSAASDIAEMIAKTRMKSDANQSSSVPLSRTTCRHARPTATRMNPRKSTLRPPLSASSRSFLTAGGSVSIMPERKSERRQTGTLIRKIQRHEKLSVMNPPSVGATTTAIP
jgi:hypothetical protein